MNARHENERWTINEIWIANRRAGQHFFSPGAMRFFDSSVADTTHCGPGGVYFVTGEKGPVGPRRFTVRLFDPDTGEVYTVGPFCKLTSHVARKRAADYAALRQPHPDECSCPRCEPRRRHEN